MTVETATYISDLNASNPGATDLKAEGDDHLRLIKSTVKATFPNVTAAVTPTHTEMNYLVGVTSALQTQINNAGLDLVQNIQSGGSGYTLVLTDRGKSVLMNGSGNFTIPNSIFSGGHWFMIYNNTGSPQTLVQGTGVTMKFGAGPSTGNRGIANNGRCTVYWITGSVCCIDGSGLS